MYDTACLVPKPTFDILRTVSELVARGDMDNAKSVVASSRAVRPRPMTSVPPEERVLAIVPKEQLETLYATWETVEDELDV